MYDSRTDKARKPQRPSTLRRYRLERDWELDNIWCSRRAKGRDDLSEREAIVDQIDEGDTPIDLPGLKRVGKIEYDRWMREWSRLYCDSGDAYDEFVDDEHMAEWEVALLDGPEGACWTTKSVQPSEREYIEADPDFDEDEWDDDTWEGRTTFLPLMSINEAYDAFGGDFTIEGPNAERVEPLKGEHYIRVHELAAEVGIESRDLIRYLRLEGEYVTNHMSMVANPVADIVRRQADGLVERFGARPAIEISGLDALRMALLNPSAPARLSPSCQTHSVAGMTRPGAPRPGNPFATPRPRAHV